MPPDRPAPGRFVVGTPHLSQEWKLLRNAASIVLEAMRCKTPAYGAPGVAHCAACCGGIGYVVTNQEELDVVNACRTIMKATSEPAIPMLDCEGSGCPPITHQESIDGTLGMCSMCGSWLLPVVATGDMPHHQRKDIIKMIETGMLG